MMKGSFSMARVERLSGKNTEPWFYSRFMIRFLWVLNLAFALMVMYTRYDRLAEMERFHRLIVEEGLRGVVTATVVAVLFTLFFFFLIKTTGYLLFLFTRKVFFFHADDKVFFGVHLLFFLIALLHILFQTLLNLSNDIVWYVVNPFSLVLVIGTFGFAKANITIRNGRASAFSVAMTSAYLLLSFFTNTLFL